MFGNTINVSAQSDSQRGAEKLIQYYEWLFETQFSGAQRSEYNQIKAEDYRVDGANERKSIDSLMEKFSAIKSKNENEQARIRGTVLGDFIKNLQDAGSDNKEAKFLLGVYEDALTKQAREAEANGTGDISAYVGKWVWAHTGSGIVSGTGVWMGTDGRERAINPHRII